jgi:hypothetical protein
MMTELVIRESDYKSPLLNLEQGTWGNY